MRTPSLKCELLDPRSTAVNQGVAWGWEPGSLSHSLCLHPATLPACLCQNRAEEHSGHILVPPHPVYATEESFWAVTLDIQILIFACFLFWLTPSLLPRWFPQPCELVLEDLSGKDPISPRPVGPEPCWVGVLLEIWLEISCNPQMLGGWGPPLRGLKTLPLLCVPGPWESSSSHV